MCTIKLNIFISKLNEFKVSALFAHLGTWEETSADESFACTQTCTDAQTDVGCRLVLFYLHLLIEISKMEHQFFSRLYLSKFPPWNEFYRSQLRQNPLSNRIKIIEPLSRAIKLSEKFLFDFATAPSLTMESIDAIAHLGQKLPHNLLPTRPVMLVVLAPHMEFEHTCIRSNVILLM